LHAALQTPLECPCRQNLLVMHCIVKQTIAMVADSNIRVGDMRSDPRVS